MSDSITDPHEIHAVLDGQVLADVEQPGQYVGGEINSIRKDPAEVEVALALCFPDVYSIGMSNLGLQILYSIVNDLPWAAAERAYAPQKDMQRRMREHGIPLWTLENFRPVRALDVVGFTLQSELLYTNVLNMLSLAGIPLECAQRGEGDPIVIAGGPGALSPEPMADFIDLFFVGDGERTIVEFLELVREAKAAGAGREDVILGAARTIEGLYAPAFYRPEYGQDGRLTSIRPTRDGLPETIRAARMDDLDAVPFPTSPVVPFVETVHDRITLEIMRGCSRGCRFCHAGTTCRPVRHRSPDRLLELANASYASTGYDEIALVSLSSSDYPHMGELLARLTERFDPLKVNICLPSLRVSDQFKLLVGPLSSVRKSGLTLAPEAAADRLRDVINKNITTEQLLEGTRAASEKGWRLVKLYFMIGLPTETDEDVAAIPALCHSILRNAAGEGRKSPLKLNVTVSPFVPKPHTPFQWEPAASQDELAARSALISADAGSRRVRYKFHDPHRSLVEAVLARGDRRLGEVIRAVWERGGQFDAWHEHFLFEVWVEQFRAVGILPPEGDGPEGPESANSPYRARDADEVLPWDHIDCGVTKAYLLRERDRAFAGETTPDCREECGKCGACVRGGS